MHSLQIRRITAFSGLLTSVAVVVAIPLYFIYPGAPPLWNVLTRDLVNLLTIAFLLIFMSGLSHLVRDADRSFEWLASLAYGAGLSFVAVALVSVALEAGVVFGTPDGSVDPTTDGPLAHGNMLIHGSIKRMLTAIYLGAAGYAVSHTRLLPNWLGWAAYAIALFNLFFLPSLYFGTDPTQFYSAHGWGNSAFAGSFLMYWILAASIVLLRRSAAGATRH
jgi:hypothetical protein